MGFVFCVDLAAKGFPLRIKYNRDIAIGIVLHEAANHIDYALHSTSRLPLAAYERRQRMEGTKEIRRPIYKNKLFWFGQLAFLFKLMKLDFKLRLFVEASIKILRQIRDKFTIRVFIDDYIITKQIDSNRLQFMAI